MASQKPQPAQPYALKLNNTQWEILAGTRFALAWIVLCGHTSFYFTDVDPVTSWIGDLGGKAAVTGFLVVSGYSIAASIRARPEGFYRRRLLRIYPLYAAAILLAYATELALRGEAQMPSGQVVTGTGPWVAMGNMALVQTFFVKPIAFNGPVWSLAVEVCFYLFAPLLLRLGRPALLGLIAISAVAYVAPRQADLGLPYFVFTHLNALIFAWAWLLGFVLHAAPRGGLAFVLAILAMTLTAANDYHNPEAAAPWTVLVVTACVMTAANPSLVPRIPAPVATGLTWLGDLSYPLYLIHFPALIIAAAFGLTSHAAAMLFAVVLSMLALLLIDVWLKRKILARLSKPRERADAATLSPH